MRASTVTRADPQIDAMEDVFVGRLDLADNPFKSEYSDRFFYTGAMRQYQYDQLQHYAQFGTQPVLLAGALGSGKSTLLRRLARGLEETMECLVESGTHMDAASDLLRVIADRFYIDLAPASTADDLLLRAPKLPGGDLAPLLLIIEDAEQCPEGVPETVHQLIQGSVGQIHVILEMNGDDNGVWEAAREQAKVIELPPLSAAEVAEYVDGRLSDMGFAGEQALTRGERDELHERSRGVISEVHWLAPVLLNQREDVAVSKKNLGLPVPHIVAALVLLVALMTAFWYDRDEATTVEVPVDLPTAAVSGVSENGRSLPDEDRTEAAPAPDVNRLTESVGEDEMVVDTAIALRIIEQKSIERSSVQQRYIQQDSLQERVTPPAERREVAMQLPLNDSDQSVAAAPDRSMTSMPEVARETPGVSNSSEAEESVKVKALPVNEKAPDKPAPGPAPVKPKLPVDAGKTAGAQLSASELRLLGFAKTGYLLQILGTHSEQSAQRVVKRNTTGGSAKSTLFYYETRHQGKPWFVVLAGPYSDRLSAQKGVESLPLELAKQPPWVRQVGEIQETIRREHGLP